MTLPATEPVRPIISTGSRRHYGYDAIYELQQVTQSNVTTESYSYDAVGNRLSSLGMSPYSYNPSERADLDSKRQLHV